MAHADVSAEQPMVVDILAHPFAEAAPIRRDHHPVPLVVVTTTLPAERQDGLYENVPAKDRTEQGATRCVDPMVTVSVRLVTGSTIPGSTGGVILDRLTTLELGGRAAAGVVEVQESEAQPGFRGLNGQGRQQRGHLSPGSHVL